MTKAEIDKLLHRLELPTIRGEGGEIIPETFTDEETDYIIYVLLEKVRRENLKGWSAIDPVEMHKLRLKRGEGHEPYRKDIDCENCYDKVTSTITRER